MFGMVMSGLGEAAGVMAEINACRKTYPKHYIRVNAFDSTRGWETIRLSFLVNRPAEEPGFRLRRVESQGRVQRYAIQPDATGKPAARRHCAEVLRQCHTHR